MTNLIKLAELAFCFEQENLKNEFISTILEMGAMGAMA
jgi:hypothetical protein